MANDIAHAIFQLERGPGRVGSERIALLAAIGDSGSIAAAAKLVGLSYKGAWDAVQALNNLFEQPLVKARTGGRSGGAAQVTDAGRTVLAAYRSIEEALSQRVDRLGQALAGSGYGADLLWPLNITTSARNTYRGMVTRISDGAVSAEVALDIGGGITIVAVITRDSIADLALTPGREAIALIKSSLVILAPGDATLRTSARNCLGGIVIRHEEGAVNDEVVLDLGAGKTITAIITRESGKILGFAVGDPAQALVKASHVILAVG